MLRLRALDFFGKDMVAIGAFASELTGTGNFHTLCGAFMRF